MFIIKIILILLSLSGSGIKLMLAILEEFSNVSFWRWAWWHMSVTLALETDTRRMLQAEGSPGLYSGTQDTLGHIVEPSLKNRRRKKKKANSRKNKNPKAWHGNCTCKEVRCDFSVMQTACNDQCHWQQYYISLYFCYEYSKTPTYFCSQLFF